MDPGQFIAAIATRSISPPGHPEDTDLMEQGYTKSPARTIFLLILLRDCRSVSESFAFQLRQTNAELNFFP